MRFVHKNYIKINDVPTTRHLIATVISIPLRFSLKCEIHSGSAWTVLIFHFLSFKLPFEESSLLGCYAMSTNK